MEAHADVPLPVSGHRVAPKKKRHDGLSWINFVAAGPDLESSDIIFTYFRFAANRFDTFRPVRCRNCLSIRHKLHFLIVARTGRFNSLVYDFHPEVAFAHLKASPADPESSLVCADKLQSAFCLDMLETFPIAFVNFICGQNECHSLFIYIAAMAAFRFQDATANDTQRQRGHPPADIAGLSPAERSASFTDEFRFHS